jgi:Glutamate 5-kinase
MIEVVDGQRQLKGCKRIVVKIGSSLLTANGQGLDLDASRIGRDKSRIYTMPDTRLFSFLPELWLKVWFE